MAIIYKPTHKGYKPAKSALIGETVKIITCLNTSETKTVDRKKQLITRFYSMTVKGKVLGHAPRFVIRNVYSTVSENTRLKVVAAGSKTPHAWLHGELLGLVPSGIDDHHNDLIKTMLEQGAVYIAFDPYKVDQFKILNTEKLPGIGANDLPGMEPGKTGTVIKQMYCYEHGILALLK